MPSLTPGAPQPRPARFAPQLQPVGSGGGWGWGSGHVQVGLPHAGRAGASPPTLRPARAGRWPCAARWARRTRWARRGAPAVAVLGDDRPLHAGHAGDDDPGEGLQQGVDHEQHGRRAGAPLGGLHHDVPCAGGPARRPQLAQRSAAHHICSPASGRDSPGGVQPPHLRGLTTMPLPLVALRAGHSVLSAGAAWCAHSGRSGTPTPEEAQGRPAGPAPVQASAGPCSCDPWLPNPKPS